MRRYQVNRFWVEKRTGSVLLEDQFSLDTQLIASVRPFSSEVVAYAYITKTKHDWLIGALTKWISHKEKVYAQSKDQQKQEALKTVRAAIDKFFDKSIEKISGNILKGKTTFEFCLPPAENNSYEQSKINLSEIFLFCEENKPKQ